jgi:hypothetical protein
MTGEHVVHPLRDPLLLIEETAGRVRDGHEVVAHLEDDDTTDLQRNALMGHAVHGEFGLVQVERELAHRLHTGQHECAAPRDDTEVHALLQALHLGLGAGDDERLVGFGDTPHEFEQTDHYQDGAQGRPRDHADEHRHTPSARCPFGTERRECPAWFSGGPDTRGPLLQS